MSRERLPVVGSTAATTMFCAERLDGPGGLHLWLDGNGKITAGNGTLKEPRPNAFSLEAEAVAQVESRAADSAGDAFILPHRMEHCPQSTPTCRAACYVGPLSRAQTETYDLYRHNSRTIRTILAYDWSLQDQWVMTLADWITRNAAGGFRWHVSGDVFSLEYARWIADVCRESSSVRSWIYTRSFDFLGPLAEVSTVRGGNLAVNLSCDRDNYAEARRAAIWHGEPDELMPKRLRLCYLSVEVGDVPSHLGPDDVVFPDYSLRPRAVASLQESEFWQSLTPRERGLVCPVDAHGKSEKIRCGPCARCLT